MPHKHLPALDAHLSCDDFPLDGFKNCIKAGADELTQRFYAGEDAVTLVHTRADFVDEVLQRAWLQYLPHDAPAALVAVGGYGRGELHPASDIDVLVIVAGDPEGELVEQLEQFVAFLWDIGLDIGHSVRTLEQCITQAEQDITITTNLMESRHLAGEESLFQAMRDSTGPDKIWPSDRFFEAKCEEQKARHAKYDNTAYNLEPNIKANPGGLRDIQMIGWVAKRHFGGETLADLVTHGFLNDAEYKSLIDGQNHLWKIRFALHLITGRHEDRLLFEHQRSIAREFGYCDENDNLAVEQFMQQYYRTVMELNRLNELLLQLFQDAIVLKHHLKPPVRINNRFQSRNDYLEVSNAGIFARYPIALLELFLVLQEHPELAGVRANTIRLVRAHLHLIDNRFRKDIRARSLFIEILRQPTGITHALRRMNRYGVLARYLPEFGSIVGRMQFDLFHVFTVEEHVLMVVRNLRRFSVPEFEDEFPLCSQVLRQLPKPELVYIAGLYHDIAKGRGGDHAKLGEKDARNFCLRHDLSAYDAELVGWLVRTHLLMSMTAQRKDIEDPAVVQEFAARVIDPVRLDYLYLLTVADIRGTNPKRWNSWKESLLNRLYGSTRQLLRRGLHAPVEQDTLIQQKQKEARRLLVHRGFHLEKINDLWMSLTLEYFIQNTPEELVWHAEQLFKNQNLSQPLVRIRASHRRGCDEIFISLHDRDKLFAHTTALLAQLQLNVLEARIQTTDQGYSINSYFVLEEDGEHIRGSERAEEITRTLEIGLSIPGDFSADIQRRIPRRMKQFTAPSEVTFTQDETQFKTLLHLNATDQPGLLSRIGEVFADQGIRVHNARITTVGAIAEDIFTITDTSDAPITDQQRLNGLTSKIQQQLDHN